MSKQFQSLIFFDLVLKGVIFLCHYRNIQRPPSLPFRELSLDKLSCSGRFLSTSSGKKLPRPKCQKTISSGSGALMFFHHSGFDIVAVWHVASDANYTLKVDLSVQSVHKSKSYSVFFALFFADFLKKKKEKIRIQSECV